MIIVLVSLPLKFISNKIDKRIPRSNIILPISVENTVHQTFRTKSYHSTSGIIAIQQIQTSDEYFKSLLLQANLFSLTVIVYKLLGPSINYVVSAGGEGGKAKDDLLSRPYLIKKTTRGGRGSKIADFETT